MQRMPVVFVKDTLVQLQAEKTRARRSRGLGKAFSTPYFQAKTCFEGGVAMLCNQPRPVPSLV